jgi:hypothetical protein
MNIQEILSQPDGSVDNIVINLDQFELKEKYAVIPQILAKCSLGGMVTVVGIEVFEFGKAISESTKSLDEVNQIINAAKSMDTLDNIKRFLLQYNFRTISVKRENGHYVCTARHTM